MSVSSVAEKQTAKLQADPALKHVTEVRPAPAGHWVGDGFPVRTMFGYDKPAETTPFLLLDYAGPRNFPPANKRRGVGEHPHRGFETVTIVYSGEVEHRDSSGGGGMIGAGDVQWMTAGSGIVHEEMHSGEFTMGGGEFEAIQLWVNLPARLKMTRPKYQTLLSAQIPSVALPDGAGRLRVIAGAFEGTKGPADTFTPVDLWDVRMNAGKGALLQTAPGRTALLMVMKGAVVVNGKRAGEAQLVVLEREGDAIRIDAESDATFLVLGGEPIDEPVFGYGPFVMTNEREIRQAIADYQAGRMGHLSAR
jgi:redox-sensitive bicupin YhaK (pirin superfamily)